MHRDITPNPVAQDARGKSTPAALAARRTRDLACQPTDLAANPRLSSLPAASRLADRSQPADRTPSTSKLFLADIEKPLDTENDRRDTRRVGFFAAGWLEAAAFQALATP